MQAVLKKAFSQQEKKANKVANLLTKLRRAGKIHNVASRKTPIWKLDAE
jgi:hypothetical protein